MINYKLNKYAYLHDCNNKVLLVNFCNGVKIVFNNKNDIDYIKHIFNKKNKILDDGSNVFKSLLSYNFLIKETVNEVDYLINNYCKYENNVLSLLIYLTNDCNFACKYCPQNHNLKSLSVDDISDISEGIIQTLSNNNNITKLHISWFGGEPLLNKKCIKLASMKLIDYCEKNSIEYNSSITTNGYLLTEKTFEELYNYKIKNYQITIDGNEVSHNNTRPLKNGSTTWGTIISNLKNISKFDYDFKINIRLNVSQDNIDQMIDMISYIKNNFDKRYYISVMPISRMGNELSNFHFCGKIESQLVQIYLYQYMIENNIDVSFIDALFNPMNLVCNSSMQSYFVVNTEKKLFKCELNVNDDAFSVGYINKDGLFIDNYVVSQYTTPSIKNKCISCKIYPLCFGLSCPLNKINNKKCDVMKDYLIDDYMNLMIKYYDQKYGL